MTDLIIVGLIGALGISCAAIPYAYESGRFAGYRIGYADGKLFADAMTGLRGAIDIWSGKAPPKKTKKSGSRK